MAIQQHGHAIMLLKIWDKISQRVWICLLSDGVGVLSPPIGGDFEFEFPNGADANIREKKVHVDHAVPPDACLVDWRSTPLGLMAATDTADSSTDGV
jgi:hypothetical protein